MNWTGVGGGGVAAVFMCAEEVQITATGRD